LAGDDRLAQVLGDDLGSAEAEDVGAAHQGGEARLQRQRRLQARPTAFDGERLLDNVRFRQRQTPCFQGLANPLIR
jgi:hypothetical protein